MGRTLYLPLKKKWYEMIECGYKTEEYREIKPYWIKRLFKCARTSFCAIDDITDEIANLYCTNPEKINQGLAFRGLAPAFDTVRFSLGYTQRTMTFKVTYCYVGRGKAHWGAPNNKVFVIGLGIRIE